MKQTLPLSVFLHAAIIGAVLVAGGWLVGKSSTSLIWVEPELLTYGKRKAARKKEAVSDSGAVPVADGNVGQGASANLSMKQVIAWGNVAPAYPDEALRKGWEGNVLLRVETAVSGEVVKVALESSSGFPVLDKAALRAAENWKFPNQWVALVPVNFILEGKN